MTGQRDALCDARHRLPAYEKARVMTGCPPSPQYCSVAPHRNAPVCKSPPVRALVYRFRPPSGDAAIPMIAASTVFKATGALAHRPAGSHQPPPKTAHRQSPQQFQYLARVGTPQPIVSDTPAHYAPPEQPPPRRVQAPPRQARRSVDKSIPVHLPLCGCRLASEQRISGAFRRCRGKRPHAHATLLQLFHRADQCYRYRQP